MALKEAIEHLYPGALSDKTITLRDDGQGAYIDYFDGSLGDRPSQSELDQADRDYREPSYLQGGTREPGLAEIETDLRLSYDYFRWRVGEKVKDVAKRYGYSVLSQSQTQRGQFDEVGSMEKAAKYAQLSEGAYRDNARALLEWEARLWGYLAIRWSAVDPRRDFTGFDGETPPTWPQLENDLDTNFPEP